MQNQTAKANLIDQAIRFYLNGAGKGLFAFMSLHSDDEPYPLDEVIAVQRERVKGLYRELADYPNSESLKTSLFIQEKQLAKLLKLKKEKTQ